MIKLDKGEISSGYVIQYGCQSRRNETENQTLES